MEANLIDVPAGLKGVIAAETAIGDVRGAEGVYHYGPYDATELAKHCTLEEVWHLLLRGRLPVPAERAELESRLRAERRLPTELLGPLRIVARAGGPILARLRSALSLAATVRGCRPVLDLTPPEREADAVALAALTPTLVGALSRLEAGLDPLPARDDLGHAAHYLWCCTGEVPGTEEARAIEQYLIATIDHGFNASTFTARVIASTGADVGAALVGGLGALSGPLHGGAPSRALAALDEIASPAEVPGWVRAATARGEKIMGFGHAVYSAPDPRSRLLHGIAQRLGGPRLAHAEAVEREVLATLRELKGGRELPTNVEFYAAIVMDRCGLPPELFTPTFAVSRVIGWSVHVLEQAAAGKIIRPSARYVGPWPLQVVPRQTAGAAPR